MNATFGILTVYLIFLLGRAMYNTQVGLWASFILATLGYHIIYSRETFGEINTLFFFVASTYFYFLSRINEKKDMLFLGVSGILAGIAFTCHYRWFLIPIFLWLYEIHLFLFYKPTFTKNKFKRFLILNLTMLLPLVMWEIPYYFGSLLFKRAGDILPFQTYLEQIIFQMFMYKGKTQLSTENIITYPYFFFKLNGPVISLLLVIGIWKTIKKASLANLILLSQLIIPFLFFTFYSIVQQNCRFLSISLAMAALVTGKGLYDLLSENLKLRYKNYFIVNILLVLIIFSFSFPINLKIINLKSGYQQAINYLNEIKGEKHITSNYYLSTFYIPHQKVKHLLPSTTIKDLRSYYKNGYRYLLTDIQKYYYIVDRHEPPTWPDKEPQVLKEIKLKIKPIQIINESRGNHLQFWAEHNRFLVNTLSFYNNLSLKDKTEIRIYDLKDYFLSPSG